MYSFCSAQFYPDGSAVDLLSPHREALKHVTHPVLGRCSHIIWTKTWANWQFFNSPWCSSLITSPPHPNPYIPSLVEGLSEVCVSSAEEAFALYETCREALKTNTGSIYSWWVKECLTLSSRNWITFIWLLSAVNPLRNNYCGERRSL